jgi:predicted TIM-barrel fold metal-dependent hydrolase
LSKIISLPVLYDVMGEVSVVELLAQEYPDVSFIIPHLGSFADDWRVHLALIDQLVRHANIYTDTAGVRRFDMLLQAFKRSGPEKILFGSDGPWLHPGVELFKVKALGLSAWEAELVLGGNLRRLISKVKSHIRLPVTAAGAPGAIDSIRSAARTEIRDPWSWR